MAISPQQLVWRRRIEAGLKVAEPVLNLVLATGDRISRVVDRDALDTPPPPQRFDPGEPVRRVGPGPRRADPAETTATAAD